MKLNYTIKEVKEETRELTTPELCVLLVKRTTWFSEPDAAKRAAEYLEDVGFVDTIGDGPSLFGKEKPNRYAKFRKESVRVATPSEIVAWNVLNIKTLCDTDGLSCNKCPLDMRSSGKCCNITTRAKNAKRIMDGKEMIVEVVL